MALSVSRCVHPEVSKKGDVRGIAAGFGRGVPPKYSVAQVIGYLKGKSAIHIAREFAGRSRNFVGQHFWARGYFVSTVGRDERVIREYIQQQEREDRRSDQLPLE